MTIKEIFWGALSILLYAIIGIIVIFVLPMFLYFFTTIGM